MKYVYVVVSSIAFYVMMNGIFLLAIGLAGLPSNHSAVNFYSIFAGLWFGSTLLFIDKVKNK